MYYKVLDGDRPIYGVGHWYLPHNGEPGEWMPPVKGELIPCINGYHLCRERDLIHWLGPDIYEAEYRGEVVEGGDKFVVREARLLRHVDTWNKTTKRLFAADCAEHVVHLGDEKALRPVIETARRYARGSATDKELDTAGSAARAAAGSAATAAARAAAWSPASAPASAVASAAVGSAARAAARAAAGDAAGNAEIEWQIRRLFEYLSGKRS